MRLARHPRRAQPETIIALIDVVFFLLVFFMLIGRMDATAPFAVAPPVARTGADMPGGGATLSVRADGSLAVDGTATDREGALAAIGARLRERPDLLVRINADGAAPLREILPLAAGIEAIGARDVVLVVTPGAPR